MSGREPVITIDGPAAAGKSTAARLLAQRLGYRLLDTGSMYRALAWSVSQAGIEPVDGPALRRHLTATHVAVDGERVSVNGRDVSEAIRTPEISALTSCLTTLAPVREKLTPIQRALAAAGGAVLEGRDTGTVICPDAEVKFYLDASLDTRARRRQSELAGRGVARAFEVVRREVEERDRQDTGRALAPLRKAADAILLDTSDRTAEQVVAAMIHVVEERRACCTSS